MDPDERFRVKELTQGTMLRVRVDRSPVSCDSGTGPQS